MSYFYIYKLCNYLLMENQKYISEINNIINKQKIEGGAFNNMTKMADDFNANKNTKGYKVPSSPVMEKIMGKPIGMAKLANAAKAQIAAKGIPGAPPMGMSGMPPMGMSGAPPPSGEETNSELKNMVKNSKENFEEYIDKINNYIQMLGSCKKGEIKEFIEKNNNSQQQISNNAEIENDLTNQQLNNKEELSNAQKEKEDIKIKSDSDLKTAQDDLEQQKKKETELKGRFEELTKEKEKLEADLETAKANAAKNSSPTNDAAAAELEKKLNEIRETEKIAKDKLEKEKVEITQKYEGILEQQQEAKKKWKRSNKKLKNLKLQ